MKTRTLFALIVMVCTITQVHAQSHSMKPGCKYAKKGSYGRVVEEGYVCPACRKENEKEQAARDAEDKRRSDASRVKWEAEKKARKIAEKKEQAEREAKNKVTEVSVKMPKNTTVQNNSSLKKKIEYTSDKTILKPGNKNFVNEKGEILFENNNWDRTYSIQDLSVTETSIQNFGIVEITTDGKESKLGQLRTDVVNSKGQYLFNDKNIKLLRHIDNGWLLISPYNSDNYWVYNLRTKEKISFTSIAEGSNNGEASNYFLPIFSDNVKFNENRSAFTRASKTIKQNLASLFPTELSEAFLSKQSFVLVHANFMTALMERDFESFKRVFDSAKTVLLYCISKDGKLSTIKLK